MNWSYLFKHWVATVILGALFLATPIMFKSSYDTNLEIIQISLFLIFYSFLLSIPTFILCVVLFNHLIDKKFRIIIAKRFIISLSIFGIFITEMVIEYWFFGSYNFINSLTILLPYTIAALISGVFFKLKRKDNQENITDQSIITQNED